MPSCSERTSRVLDIRLAVALLSATLTACDGDVGSPSTQPDAGSCCGNCLPGYSGTYCVRCPGLWESCTFISYDDYGCEGLSGQALCDCVVDLPTGGSEVVTRDRCQVVDGVAVYTASAEACVHAGPVAFSDACEYNPASDEPRLPRWQGGGPGQ